jgi:mevalonate kinase
LRPPSEIWAELTFYGPDRPPRFPIDTFVYSAPTKVILFSKHSVVYGHSTVSDREQPIDTGDRIDEERQIGKVIESMKKTRSATVSESMTNRKSKQTM